jgi:preprotein translocase, SecE subunit, bacterial
MLQNTRRIMIAYIKESFQELKNNVTWLERAKASNLMVIVAVFSIVFALVTWGVDSLFSKLIRLYFEKLIG